MNNATSKMQAMLVSAGFAESSIALAAARSGEFEVMDSLLTNFGADVFKTNQSSGMRSAYEYAASTNRVDVMRWLMDKRVLPPLEIYSKYGDFELAMSNQVHCPLAFMAAQHGAFDALEFVADQMPQVRELPVLAAPTSIDMMVERSDGKWDKSSTPIVGHEDEVSYAGLLAICALAARTKGVDAEPIVGRLREHLATGAAPMWRDLEIALRFDQLDLATLLMESGAKIVLPEFFKRLEYYQQPVNALATISDHMQATGKVFDGMSQPYVVRDSSSISVEIDSYERLLATPNAFCPLLHSAMTAVEGFERNVRREYKQAPHRIDCLSAEVVRFLGLMGPELAGTSLLARALKKWHVPMVTSLLESGVNPNDYPLEQSVHESGAAIPPVHVCGSPDLLRLLYQYGADVNLPKRDNDDVNLLQILCTKIDVDSEMLHAFAECGGDFVRKFEGKTAASLAKKKGDDFYAVFMSAKTSIAVAKSVDSQMEGMTAIPSKSPKMSPL